MIGKTEDCKIKGFGGKSFHAKKAKNYFKDFKIKALLKLRCRLRPEDCHFNQNLMERRGTKKTLFGLKPCAAV